MTYRVTDQNGDVLYESPVWAHAAAYFRQWLPAHNDPSLAGACIVDDDGVQQMAYAPISDDGED